MSNNDYVRFVAVGAAGLVAGWILAHKVGRRPKPQRIENRKQEEKVKHDPDTHYDLVKIENLADIFVGANIENVMMERGGGSSSYNQFIGSDQGIVVDVIIKANKIPRPLAYVRAGPRKYLHFNPTDVNAAIVTCGGLCPGLNNVIRGITKTLVTQYKAKRVIGVMGGTSSSFKSIHIG